MMDEAETTEAVNRRVRVANMLIRQALGLVRQANPSRTGRAGGAASVVDAQLLADLQLSMAALRQAWTGAEQA